MIKPEELREMLAKTIRITGLKERLFEKLKYSLDLSGEDIIEKINQVEHFRWEDIDKMRSDKHLFLERMNNLIKEIENY